MSRKFVGKYRATVLNNADPMQIGRIVVKCSSVLGDTPSDWAMPAFPVTGPQMGAWWLPQIGADVWIEFEQGDRSHPIWSGCWFASAAEVPALALAAPPGVSTFVIQ